MLLFLLFLFIIHLFFAREPQREEVLVAAAWAEAAERAARAAAAARARRRARRALLKARRVVVKDTRRAR